MGFFSFQHQNPFLQLDSPIYDYPSQDEAFNKMQFLTAAEQGEDMGNNASSSIDQCGSSSIGASTTPLIPSSPSSSSLVAVPHPCSERAAALIKPQDKKRKSRCGSSLSSSQSKESKESSKARSKVRNEESKAKNGVKSEAKSAGEEPAPKGYIHVRARRGQATDSHSLAERVRRERISERMRMLQGLVPGCDKVTGKALMLDEIINYVQSLQNQVEFLSMKLASMSPILYGLGSDFDGLVDQAQGCSPNFEKYSESMSVTIPCVHPETSPLQPIAFEGALGAYPMISNSTSLSLQNQGPISFSQDTGNFLMQVGDQRQGLLNQVVFNDMCSFQ